MQRYSSENCCTSAGQVTLHHGDRTSKNERLVTAIYVEALNTDSAITLQKCHGIGEVATDKRKALMQPTPAPTAKQRSHCANSGHPRVAQDASLALERLACLHA
jgi:hypothetical protein